MIGQYRNGNYKVTLFEDGTKVRENDLDYFEADFPESMDLKICDRCDMGCPMCHENSTPNGKLGDIMHLKFIENLHPYTELAIGGGNPLEHPSLVPFLEKCKKLQLVPSMTVHQKHFYEYRTFIKSLVEHRLIYGVGISVTNEEPTDEFIQTVQQFPNAVLHIINGYTPFSTIEKLKHKNLKVLILGYKQFRRGANLFEQEADNIISASETLKTMLPTLIKDKWFSVISFDNLAISQLEVQSVMTPEAWSQFYMGDDGQDGEMTSASMYVDAVKQEFARNSCSTNRYSPLLDSAEEMYQYLKGV